MIGRLIGLLFFGGLGLALALIVTGAHATFLPSGLASQIGHNSEALALALLVAALIHVYRRRGRGAWCAVVGLVLVVAGLLLQRADLPTSVVTLNEALVGAGLIAWYLLLPRSPVVGVVTSAAILLAVVVFFDTTFVLDQAESLVPAILVPLALDVFDRRLLQPWAPDNGLLRVLWIAFLCSLAVGSMLAARWARQDLSGPLKLGIDYSQRAAEAYWGWLLVHVYFLCRRWGARGTD